VYAHFGLLDLRRDRTDNVGRDFVLQVKNIFKAAVETVRPQMRAGQGIDQLPGDANLVTSLADAAFEHIAHAELSADLFDIDGLALVDKA
jgi:hypothetical protein